MSVFNAALGQGINSGGLREAAGTWAASSTRGHPMSQSSGAPWWLRCAGAAWTVGGPELLALGAWDLFAQGVAAGANS